MLLANSCPAGELHSVQAQQHLQIILEHVPACWMVLTGRTRQ
jgi:hypothetical protein